MAKKTNSEKRMTILLLNMLIVFILASLTAFIIDGWVRHPIKVAEDDSMEDILAQTEYANASIVDLPQFSVLPRDLVLVEQNGTLRLLAFSSHRMSGQFRLLDAVTVEPNFSGTVRLGPKGNQRAVFFEHGTIVNTSGGVVFAGNPHYSAIAMLFTAAESALLWLILKKKYPNES